MQWTLELQKILEEVKRQNTRKKVNLGIMKITSTGVKIAHGLGRVPDEFNITAIARNGSAAASWYHYQEPDAAYIYIKASADGYFLVCVAGG